MEFHSFNINTCIFCMLHSSSRWNRVMNSLQAIFHFVLRCYDANLFHSSLTISMELVVRESQGKQGKEEKWKDVLVLSESFIKFFTINFSILQPRLLLHTDEKALDKATVGRAYAPSLQIKNLNRFLIFHIAPHK